MAYLGMKGVERKEALSWAELLGVVGYVMLVRKFIRPWLIRRWKYFQDKLCAPYIIGFMVLLILCAFLLIFKLEPVAEEMANIAYFLLVVGVGVEFYQMVKNKA